MTESSSSWKEFLLDQETKPWNCSTTGTTRYEISAIENSWRYKRIAKTFVPIVEIVLEIQWLLCSRISSVIIQSLRDCIGDSVQNLRIEIVLRFYWRLYWRFHRKYVVANNRNSTIEISNTISVRTE